MRKKIIIVSIMILTLVTLILPYKNPDVLIEIHLEMWHYRDGILIDYSHHPGVLTNQGADFAEDQLGDSPAADPAKWIAVSNDASAPSATWVVLPNEITTGS